MGRLLPAAAIALAGLATGVDAQQSTNRVATKTDWSVFAESSPKECWGVSSPKQSASTRDGKPVQAKRSDILLFVTFRPGNGGKGEISFTGGYPFAPGSTVSANVEGTTFQLMTDGDWAWPANAQDDAQMLAAMKRGSSAVLSAKSARGTQTKDTFSLAGFSAAMQDAESRCK